MTQTLTQLENRGEFIRRHIGASPEQQLHMLKTVGAASLEDLTRHIVPDDIQLDIPPAVGEGATEQDALAELKTIAGLNQQFTSYIGQGYAPTILPPVILRNLLENPGWYTAYTPYQPEISQGRLEALLNFQQVTIDLTVWNWRPPHCWMKRPRRRKPWRWQNVSVKRKMPTAFLLRMMCIRKPWM